ncbi:NfeD family protein [Pseudoduganella violacea]|uniref:Membrane protein implicated in regulation of membrane protease activity n=1 Tax=Pseudoduganella violacea TaxID=1715466 RepID=A0A7W5BG38_9BURK|nr:NfeD family protein [Pseudoduganella violacea]MBB3122230.1 membrane protein implicated in regulation of membrane protease activity [Pseudoduganella violacea]
MANWGFWLLAAAVVVACELLSGTFYLLMIAIGLASGALAALAGAEPPVQVLVAAVVGVIATLLLRRSRFGRGAKVDAAADPNVNMDVGQTVHVTAWQDHTARVMYRGALWDVELEAGAVAAPGIFRIHEVRGSRLIVGV